MGCNSMLLVSRVSSKQGLKDRLLNAVRYVFPLAAQAVEEIAVHHLSADCLYLSLHPQGRTVKEEIGRIRTLQKQHVSHKQILHHFIHTGVKNHSKSHSRICEGFQRIEPHNLA